MTAWDKQTRVVAAVALLGLLATRDVHAYLDPGAGSMAFQVIVAALAAAAYGVKSYWGRLKGIFTRLTPSSVSDSPGTAPDRDE